MTSTMDALLLLVCLLQFFVQPIAADCDNTCVGLAVGLPMAAVILVLLVLIILCYRKNKSAEHHLDQNVKGVDGLENGHVNKAYDAQDLSYRIPIPSVPNYVACIEYKQG